MRFQTQILECSLEGHAYRIGLPLISTSAIGSRSRETHNLDVSDNEKARFLKMTEKAGQSFYLKSPSSPCLFLLISAF